MFFLFVLHTNENKNGGLNKYLYNQREAKALTGNERHGVEGVPPLVRNFDRFSGLGVIRHGVSLLVCMPNNFLHIKRVQRVQNIEEIFAIRYASFGQLLREVLHELHVFLRHRPEFDHGKFVKERHIYEANLFQLEKLLFFCEDFFEEVFVHHVLRRQV